MASLAGGFRLRPVRTLFINGSLTILRSARDYGVAHLLCIKQPNSQPSARDTAEFAAVGTFQSLLPVLLSLVSSAHEQ